MSAQQHPGSMGSYVIGYLLSLVFTAIPVFLVVNKVLTGAVLFGTILGFGVLQMLVQIVFFLHLGRGPKPLYNIAFFGATVGMILVVVGGSVIIMTNLHGRMSPATKTTKLAQGEGIAQIHGADTGACQGVGENHIVTIRGGVVNTPLVDARRCDTITFVNDDAAARAISFGTHPRQDAYGGEIELSVTNRRNKSITLNQTGTYSFHDHQDPAVSGRFTVSP